MPSLIARPVTTSDKKIVHVDCQLSLCKICHIFKQSSELTMDDKQKHGRAMAKESGGMRFFHPSAPFHENYGDAGFD